MSREKDCVAKSPSILNWNFKLEQVSHMEAGDHGAESSRPANQRADFAHQDVAGRQRRGQPLQQSATVATFFFLFCFLRRC